MKIILLALFIIFLQVILSSRVKQLVLDGLNDELFSDEAVTLAHSQLSTANICNNLVEFISSFGADVMANYAEIKYKDQLLGYNNQHYKQKDLISETYMDYMRTMCDFYLTETENPFPEEMKKLVLSQLKACKNGESCQGFDLKKLQVYNAQAFCQSVEDVTKGGQYYDGQDFKQRLDFEDQDWRMYSFMPADYVKQCKQLLGLFNLCIRVHNLILVKKGNAICFTSKFSPYSGATVTYYQQPDKQKCSDFILPQFLLTNSKQVLFPPESENYCENMPTDIRKVLFERIEELTKKMNEIKFKKQIMQDQIDQKKEIKRSTERMVLDISLSEKEWSKCYGAIQSRASLSLKPSLQVFKNLKLLVEVIDQLFALGSKVSLLATEQSFIQANVLNLKDVISVYYRKINTTISNNNQVCQNIQSLYQQELDQKQKAIQNNEYYTDEVDVKIKEGDLTQQQNKYVDSNTDFKQLLHSVLQKLKAEAQESQYDFLNLDSQLDYYSSISISLQQQKKIIITYAS